MILKNGISTRMAAPLLACLVVSSASLGAQQGRPQVRLDRGDTPGSLVQVAGEGPLRAVLFPGAPGRLASETLRVAVSTDHGVTWGPPVDVPGWAGTGSDVSYPDVTVASGVIHVVWAGWTHGTIGDHAWYARSADAGRTWQVTMFPEAVRSDHATLVAGGGDDVLLVYGAFFSPWYIEPLTRWSRDGGRTWGPARGLNMSISGPIEWVASVAVSGHRAHVLYFSSQLGRADRDAWFTVSEDGGPWRPVVRLDQDPTGTGEANGGRLVVDGSHLHVVWREWGRAGTGGQAGLLYRRSVDGGRTWEPEQLLPAGGAWVPWVDDYQGLAAADRIVAVAWSDWRSGALLPYVRISVDGGRSFAPDQQLPVPPGGEAEVVDCHVEGSMVVVVSNGRGVVSRPILHFSADGGATWTGPVELSKTPAGYASTLHWVKSSFLADGSLTAAWWRQRQGTWDLQHVFAGGMRLPWIEANPAGTRIVLEMHGVSPLRAGSLARWALSNALGRSPHPDRPGFLLDLAPSPLLAWSLSQAAAARLTATVDLHGEAATAPLAVPPGIPPGTLLWVQGWVLSGAVGSPPSDPTAVTTP